MLKGTFLSPEWCLLPSALGVRRWHHPQIVNAPVSSLSSKELRLLGKGCLCAFLSPFPPGTQETGIGHKFGEKPYCSLPKVHHELSKYQPGGAAWAWAKTPARQAPAAHLL